MCIKDVAYRIAHQYPGGVPALALRMGKSANVLKNKLGLRVDSHHLNVEELEMMVDFVDTDEVARYFAEQRGLVCIQAPTFDGLSDSALLDLFLTLEAEKGHWASALMEALSGGQIDRTEFVKIKRRYNDFVIACAEVMSRIESYLGASELRTQKRGQGW